MPNRREKALKAAKEIRDKVEVLIGNNTDIAVKVLNNLSVFDLANIIEASYTESKSLDFTNTGNCLDDFAPGDKVVFIPSYACNNITHKDCKFGVVKRVSEQWVFVKYEKYFTTSPTEASNLVKI